MNSVSRGIKKIRTALSGILPVIACLLCSLFIGNTSVADELCIRSFSSPSSLDGVVAPGESTATCTADATWAQVGPAHYHPTATSVESYMYIARITSTNKLRIGIDTAGDPDVSNADTTLMFFDANNNGVWDNQDFAIRYRISPQDVPITANENCNLPGGTVEYFERNGTLWESNTIAANQISVKYSYDFTKPDPEDQIWNVEFEFPINSNAPFHLNTSGPGYFAVGGYIFADRGHLPTPDPLGQVKVWPSLLESTVLNAVPQIGQYNSQLALLEPAASMLGNINLEDVCFDVNFDMAEEPWKINNLSADVGSEHLHKNANNAFRVTYYFDGPGNIAAEMRQPNAGDVRLGLMPHHASAWTDDWWWKTKNVEPTLFNSTHTVDYNFDFATAPDSDFRSDETDMVCAHAHLENFTINDNHSNDYKSMNLQYFTTSESRVSVKLYGKNLPKLKSGEIKKIYLQMEMSNEHPKMRQMMTGVINFPQQAATTEKRNISLHKLSTLFTVDNSSIKSIWSQVFVSLVLVTLSLVSLLTSHRSVVLPRITLVFGILLIIGPILTACSSTSGPVKPPEQGDIAPRWQLVNSEKLGLRPVKGKKDMFELPLQREEVKTLDFKFIGQPLPYKMMKKRLNATIEGKPNKIEYKVKPGSVVTIMAFGEVDVDGKRGSLPPTSASGFTRKRNLEPRHLATDNARPMFFGVSQKVIGKTNAVENTKKRYLLTKGYYSPNEHTGALIGSFDGFRTSFVVGKHKSIVVPKEANTISLAVNATLESYANMVGFFDIGLISTQAPTVPTRTIPGGDATYHIPMSMSHWHTLTSLNVYTFIEDPFIENGQVTMKTMRPWGQTHLVIYDSHATEFTKIGIRR